MNSKRVLPRGVKSPFSMRFAGCYLGLLGTLCTAPLHAAQARGASTTFTLAYAAPLECPSRVEFVSALRARPRES